MIARVWRGRTRVEHGDDYVEYVKKTGIAEHRATTGNRGSMLLRREAGAETEFYVISFWESLDAVRAFAGADPEVAVYFPEDEKYLLEFEPNVRHYEVSAYESDSAP